MPIAENFPEGLKPLGKISDGEGHFHIMWGPGRSDAEIHVRQFRRWKLEPVRSRSRESGS